MGSDYVPIKTMPKSQLAQDGQADTRHSPLSATSHSRSSALLLGTFLHSSGMLMATAYSWKKQKTKQKNLASLLHCGLAQANTIIMLQLSLAMH